MTRRAGVSPRRASIKDVAILAGVSVGTVSNVLNKPSFVTEPTRLRVEQAMADLQFVRNGTARQLRAGHSLTVGVVVLDLANPFYTELARGIEDRLASEEHLLMLCSSDEDPERERRYLRQFVEQGVRGILITPFQTTPEWFSELSSLRTPFVLLDTHSTDLPSVGVDNVEGARLAVDHLLAAGHRRIGLVNGPADLQQCRDRATGAEAAVTARGLDEREVLVRAQLREMNADSGAAAVAGLLDAHPDLTALFCVNDTVALGALRELRIRGVDVPQQVAVVGYDDVPLAKELRVPLTSVRQPMHDIGWRAADMLLTQQTEHVSFVPELIVRASSDVR